MLFYGENFYGFSESVLTKSKIKQKEDGICISSLFNILTNILFIGTNHFFFLFLFFKKGNEITECSNNKKNKDDDLKRDN